MPEGRRGAAAAYKRSGQGGPSFKVNPQNPPEPLEGEQTWDRGDGGAARRGFNAQTSEV